MEVAQQLSIWGEACDDDVSDVTDKLGVLLYEIGELEDQYVDRYDQYRVTIKSIRNIEASGISVRMLVSNHELTITQSNLLAIANRRLPTRLLNSNIRSRTHRRLSFLNKSLFALKPSLSSPRPSCRTLLVRS